MFFQSATIFSETTVLCSLLQTIIYLFTYSTTEITPKINNSFVSPKNSIKKSISHRALPSLQSVPSLMNIRNSNNLLSPERDSINNLSKKQMMLQTYQKQKEQERKLNEMLGQSLLITKRERRKVSQKSITQIEDDDSYSSDSFESQSQSIENKDQIDEEDNFIIEEDNYDEIKDAYFEKMQNVHETKLMNDVYIENYYNKKLLGVNKEFKPIYTKEQIQEMTKQRRQNESNGYRTVKSRFQNDKHKPKQSLIFELGQKQQIVHNFGNSVLNSFEKLKNSTNIFQKLNAKLKKNLLTQEKTFLNNYKKMNQEYFKNLKPPKIKYWTMKTDSLLSLEKKIQAKQLEKMEKLQKEEKQMKCLIEGKRNPKK